MPLLTLLNVHPVKVHLTFKFHEPGAGTAISISLRDKRCPGVVHTPGHLVDLMSLQRWQQAAVSTIPLDDGEIAFG